MRILHLEFNQYPEEAQKKLLEIGEVVPLLIEFQHELITYLKVDGNFDVVFTRLGLLIDKEIIELIPKLKIIATSTTGLNHIDCRYAEAKGIKVLSLKGESVFLANVKSTAEHTWLLVLSLLRHHIDSVNDVVEKENWNRLPFLSEEINGKTIGIIGFGRLGKIVANYAQAFSAKVLVNDIIEPKKEVNDSIQYTSIEDLLKYSDVVILMINYSDLNVKFFDEEKFALMKKKSYFINTSRGELVDEIALLNALENGKIQGAGLDVVDGDSAWESKFSGNRMLLKYAREHSNLIITPHMGGYGKTSIGMTRNFIVEKFLIKLNENNKLSFL
jgi:D-3-phosphoglycerate dehydrogenase